MNVLIVYAHPEPRSFCAAMLLVAVQALEGAGHHVQVSDLYAMGFDPVSDRRNFRTMADPDMLHQQVEEAYAHAVGGFVPELDAEMQRLASCDLLLFLFPIWWLGMPAILKGWVDRTFAVGVAYGGGRWFERGALRGKRALCVVATGGLPQAYDGSGHYEPIETVLYPIHRGILEFTGFQVLQPFVAYGPSRVDDAQRHEMLAALRRHLAALD